ncbi:MAG: hypothetical protein JXB85_10635 [Anaerolineales bacterium]|nr:hypothetical protein [Anaerolineales bacterium]
MAVPQLPEAFISVFGLGSRQAFYRARQGRRVGNLVACILLLGAACGLLLYGLYAAYTGYQQHGPAMIDDRLLVPGILALICFSLGALAGWGAYANWNKAVALYADGLAYCDRKGMQSWQWRDVRQMFSAVTRHYTQGIYTGTTHVYTLHHRDGRRLVLNDAFKQVEEIAKAIDQHTFALLFEQAVQEYNAGQTLAFGPVTVNKGGILIGKKTYPWAEVQQVSIHQGFLRISKKGGGWFSGASASAASIPNLLVLLNIINQQVGVRTG